MHDPMVQSLKSVLDPKIVCTYRRVGEEATKCGTAVGVGRCKMAFLDCVIRRACVNMSLKVNHKTVPMVDGEYQH